MNSEIKSKCPDIRAFAYPALPFGSWSSATFSSCLFAYIGIYNFAIEFRKSQSKRNILSLAAFHENKKTTGIAGGFWYMS